MDKKAVATKKRVIKKVEEVTLDLYPDFNLHTNHYQLGFSGSDVLHDSYRQWTDQGEYFDYMIKLLGGEKNLKSMQFNKDTSYWEASLNNVMDMYKAREALKDIERIEPYIDPETKQQEARNYFLFREPRAGECRIYANLLQGESEGIAVLKTNGIFSEAMSHFAQYLDGKQIESNEVE